MSTLQNVTVENAATVEHPIFQMAHIFTRDKSVSTGMLKRKLKIIQNSEEALTRILDSGEKVLFVTEGMLNKPMEQMLMGNMSAMLNRKAFFFTTKRIVLFQMNGAKVWDLKSMIRYESIKEFKCGTFGAVTLKCNNKKSYTFTGIKKFDRTFMNEIVNGTVANIPDEKKEIAGEENMCPTCGTAVQGFPSECSADGCGQKFKSATKAGLLSLLFPGAGDMYLGHRFIATMEIFSALFLWFVFLMILSEDGADLITVVIVMAFPIIFAHIPDAIFTHYVGKKGIYPQK